jgi:hypothetical protein
MSFVKFRLVRLKLVGVLVLANLLSCSESIPTPEEIPCEYNFDHVNNEIIGCYWSFTEWGNIDTYTFLGCTTQKDAFERGIRQGNKS